MKLIYHIFSIFKPNKYNAIDQTESNAIIVIDKPRFKSILTLISSDIKDSVKTIA